MEREGERKGEKMRRSEEKPGKEATRLHSEKHSCPRRRDTVADEAVLRRCFRCQPERGGKAFWDAEQLDRDLASRWIPRIASEAFCPRKASVRTLRAGKDHICLTWRSDGGRRQAHLDALVSHELPTGSPGLSAAPVPPKQRRGTHRGGGHHSPAPPGLPAACSMPMALRRQRTGPP